MKAILLLISTFTISVLCLFTAGDYNVASPAISLLLTMIGCSALLVFTLTVMILTEQWRIK